MSLSIDQLAQVSNAVYNEVPKHTPGEPERADNETGWRNKPVVVRTKAGDLAIDSLTWDADRQEVVLTAK